MTSILHHSLILSAAPCSSAALDKLAAELNWPLLVDVSVVRLRRELFWRQLTCALFWLENGESLLRTTGLVAWLRDHAPRVHRIAVAQRAEEGIEVALRTAGIHVFFPASGDAAGAVLEALSPRSAKASPTTATTPHAPHRRRSASISPESAPRATRPP